jgi:hypothetical protein
MQCIYFNYFVTTLFLFVYISKFDQLWPKVTGPHRSADWEVGQKVFVADFKVLPFKYFAKAGKEGGGAGLEKS